MASLEGMKSWLEDLVGMGPKKEDATEEHPEDAQVDSTSAKSDSPEETAPEAPKEISSYSPSTSSVYDNQTDNSPKEDTSDDDTAALASAAPKGSVAPAKSGLSKWLPLLLSTAIPAIGGAVLGSKSPYVGAGAGAVFGGIKGAEDYGGARAAQAAAQNKLDMALQIAGIKNTTTAAKNAVQEGHITKTEQQRDRQLDIDSARVAKEGRSKADSILPDDKTYEAIAQSRGYQGFARDPGNPTTQELTDFYHVMNGSKEGAKDIHKMSLAIPSGGILGTNFGSESGTNLKDALNRYDMYANSEKTKKSIGSSSMGRY